MPIGKAFLALTATCSSMGDIRLHRRRRSTKGSAASEVVVDGMAEVVDLKKARENQPTRAERKLAEFYAKNQHVVADSVREPTKADLKQLSHCHGKVCTITCVDTGEARVVNVQYAHQVKRTAAAQQTHLRRRRAERRKTRKEARAAKQTASA